MKPEAFNSTYRRALTITVMDHIREQFAQGREVTNGTLFESIATATEVRPDRALRKRIEVCVRDLELAGHITRQVKPNPNPNDLMPYKAITPTKK